MPGSGTCGAMFTANTMSTAAEAIGLMLPRGASHPADTDARSDLHADVRAQALASVDALYRLMADLRRDFVRTWFMPVARADFAEMERHYQDNRTYATVGTFTDRVCPSR